jgi:hypothetical protein
MTELPASRFSTTRDCWRRSSASKRCRAVSWSASSWAAAAARASIRQAVERARELPGRVPAAQHIARYEPSGNHARLEADRSRAAGEGDGPFATMPRTVAGPIAEHELRRPGSCWSGTWSGRCPCAVSRHDGS